MEITKTLKATYPTVTYGNCEVFVAVKLAEKDLPSEVQAAPLEQRIRWMGGAIDVKLQEEFVTLRNQVEQNLADKYLGSVVPPAVEQAWISKGRLKR